MKYLIPLLILIAAVAYACGGDDDAPAPTPSPGPAVSPAPTPAPTAAPRIRGDIPLYIALGDSLSFGVAATEPARTGFVPQVADALGPDVGLLNLGIPGDTSFDLLRSGPLEFAVAEISSRRDDGREGNEVKLVTLLIGGNDLLDIYFNLVIPGTCPSVSEALERSQCVDALRNALDNYRPNLAQAIETLQAEDPDLPIILMTNYNPFSGGGGVLDELGILSLEGMADTPFPGGLNTIIRETAQEYGLPLVDFYPLFEGRSRELVSTDLIHPNDAGYAVMAEAVVETLEELGLLNGDN